MDISPQLITDLENILGKAYVFIDMDTRKNYGHDETEDYVFPPSVVLKPGNTAEIAAIMKLAHANKIWVTPIGGRTGLSGGALAIREGIGLSLERLNKIIEIDEQNLQVTTEPAVITQVLREAVAEKGLFYPPDPSSQGSWRSSCCEIWRNQRLCHKFRSRFTHWRNHLDRC
jgi:glycolate oxidase